MPPTDDQHPTLEEYIAARLRESFHRAHTEGLGIPPEECPICRGSGVA